MRWFQRQKETIFVFVHLPRCAGTFLLRSFSWLGKRRQIVVSESPESKQAALSFVRSEVERRHIKPDSIELIGGHDTFFGIHSDSARQPFYFTFLRDPVDRYLSNFRFLRDCAVNPGSFVHEFAKQAMLEKGEPRPLEQLVEQGRLANMMTHYLAASVAPDLETARWDKEDDRTLVRLAKSAIDRFEFIGMFEHLERDARFICQKMGVPFKPRQVNQTRSQLEGPVSEKLISRIADLNCLDQEVFDYGREVANRQPR